MFLLVLNSPRVTWIQCRAATCLVHLRDCKSQPNHVRIRAGNEQAEHNARRRYRRAETNVVQFRAAFAQFEAPLSADGENTLGIGPTSVASSNTSVPPVQDEHANQRLYSELPTLEEASGDSFTTAPIVLEEAAGLVPPMAYSHASTFQQDVVYPGYSQDEPTGVNSTYNFDSSTMWADTRYASLHGVAGFSHNANTLVSILTSIR